VSKVVINVEYVFEVKDPKAAGLMVDLAMKQGPTFGSDNWSLWEFNPTETVVSAVISDGK
jgi:hypothetical protein